MNKVIYLPKEWGDGSYNVWGYPRVIYIFREFKNEYVGSAWEQEAQEKRGRWYPKNRCLLYTDENWELCVQHIRKRNELKAEYEKLLKLAKRKK